MRAVRVDEVMLRSPIVLPGSATVAEVREVFGSTHVHMVLLTASGRVGEQLLGTLVRADLDGAAGGEAASTRSRLDGRSVRADEPADAVRTALVGSGRRRLAVVDHAGGLLGLLCLKRHGDGFCTDAGVASRRRARQVAANPDAPLTA